MAFTICGRGNDIFLAECLMKGLARSKSHKQAYFLDCAIGISRRAQHLARIAQAQCVNHAFEVGIAVPPKRGRYISRTNPHFVCEHFCRNPHLAVAVPLCDFIYKGCVNPIRQVAAHPIIIMCAYLRQRATFPTLRDNGIGRAGERYEGLAVGCAGYFKFSPISCDRSPG